MAEGSGVLSQGPTLAPHDAPNMLSLFMTQYDYDYHRTSAFGSTGGEASKAPGEDGDEMSGDVRNRPVDLHASTGEGLSNASVYTTDYTRRDSRFRGPVSALVAAASRPRNAQEWGTAFIRERHPPTSGPLRPSLDDVTTYREAYGPVDMNEFQHLQQVASRGEDDVEPYLHPGARASSYVHDFLYIDDTGSDPNASVAPKITSRESLLPKVATGNSHPRGGHDGKGESFGHRPVPRRPLNMFGGKGDYFCHSTLYGDSSLAHPTQLPRGVLDSSNAHLIPHIHDKAKLLTLLSGRGAHDARRQPVAESEWKTSSSQYDPSDDTNPVMMAQTELARSQVSRRLENEGFIKKTIYQSDFIDQKLLPELPNNTLGGAAAGADSLAGMAATSGATPLFSRSGCGGYAAADVEESLASGQARELAATINNAVYGGVIRARAAPNLRSSKSNSAGDSGWRHSRYSKQFVGAPGPRAASLSAALNSTSFLYPGQLPMPVRAGAGGGTAASSVAGMAQARLCAGDMLEGTLTKRAKEGELHRNSHGYLKDSRPHTVSAGEWAKLEDADLLARVDSRGDPHQQKMR